MAITYDGSLLTDLGRVRFHLGDTVDDSGPKPADANFTDAELNGLITSEGTWPGAVAAGFENLAGLWAKHPTFNADGMATNQSDIATQYRESAVMWRQRAGSPASAQGSGMAPVCRADGYSQDLDNVTVSE